MDYIKNEKKETKKYPTPKQPTKLTILHADLWNKPFSASFKYLYVINSKINTTCQINLH